MKNICSTFFECKVRYEKLMDDGLQRKTVEQYAVEALSWTEAEAKITEEMTSYVSGEFDVIDIKNAKYGEVFLSDNTNDDKFYKARVSFIVINEKTEKEKRTSNTYLVQASSIDKAKKVIDEAMGSTMCDYEVKKIAETKLLDVFIHKADEEKQDEI